MIYAIDSSDGIPKHLRLKEDLKNRIRIRELKVGDRFLTSRQIMKEYRLSHATVSHAMKDLVKEGLLERKVGEGTYIKSLPERNSTDNKSNSVSETMLFIMSIPVNVLIKINPLNWFIREEIQRGIINNYNGPVRLVEDGDLIDEFEKCKRKKAIIMLNPDAESELKIKETGALLIIIDHARRMFTNDWNVVTLEHITGVQKLMSYLIRILGHKKIGFITNDSHLHADRIAGYEIGLRSHGLKYNSKLVEKLTYSQGSEQDGYQAMKNLLERNKKSVPTAVFVDTDLKAFGAIQAAKDFGLKVPEDISIAGFDDMPRAHESEPPLTTVKIPNYELGKEAVKQLERKLSGEKMDRGVILQAELVIRQSCAVKRTL